ncbi:MAG: AAA family ATPase [Prolixibacteraceae bacterium]|nr:AAA family ATPase [Prolixibacteraceae bacterium]
MENFLTHIHIKKIFHLENIDIPIDEKEMKHLIITGKNGSGKTSLLNAIASFFNNLIFDIKYPSNYSKSRKKFENSLYNLISSNNEEKIEKEEFKQFKNNEFSAKLIPSFSGIKNLTRKILDDDFILTYYPTFRKPRFKESKTPQKPELNIPEKIEESLSTQFLNFLVDLKIQEALARNENETDDAKKINEWFISFENLLREIFDYKNLKLEFNYKDYSFTINQDRRRFGFNQLADGYSAIIDIVSDLILKMQHPNSLVRAYEREGIVLIDEIETHLHIELQRLILPFLTRVFPKIQFIVTTHSPFVINSIPNVVVFDLERKIRLENLTEYSYEALAEGYFKVDTDSAFLQNRLNRFKELAQKPDRDMAEAFEYKKLDEEFAKLNEVLAPQYVKNEYLKTKIAAKP